MPGRLIAYAGSTVSLQWTGEDAAGIADFVFGAFPSPGPADPAPVSTFACGPGSRPGSLALARDGMFTERDDPGTLAEIWMSTVSYDLAYHSRGGLLLHAGALVGKQGAVLLPGQSGIGKTTLVLWLASRGHAVLTDELVFVPEGTTSVVPCPRPLNLKRPSRELLRGVVDLEGHAAHVFENELGCLVSLGFLNPDPPPGALPLRLALFPRYEPGSSLTLEPLSKSQTALEFMQCLVNARNLPEHGLPGIARLAAAAPAYRLRYSSLNQLEAPLRDLLG